MWTLINDCGKQITLHAKLREQADGYTRIYQVVQVEFDQYKLELLMENNMPTSDQLQVVFTCDNIMKYRMEVES